MGYPGSRTKSTDTWLLPSDEDSLGETIASAMPGSSWRCSHIGPAESHPKHLHPTIAEAMNCGGVQAFLPLPVGADPFRDESAAQVQLHRSRIWEDEQGRAFSAGRLAVRWFEPEVGPAMHTLLTDQCASIWQALRRSTLPAHIEDLGGRQISGERIGPAALKMTRAEAMPLSLLGWTRYRLRT